MRTLIFILLIFAVARANAQLTIAVKAGANNNTAKLLKKKDLTAGTGGNHGWQAGLHIEYALKHWYIYAGPELNKTSFFIHYASFAIPLAYQGGDSLLRYNPLYANLPLGIGYRYAISKNVSVNLFAGAYASVGIGGTVKKDVRPLQMCGDFAACAEQQPNTTKQAITYGNNHNDDISKINAGLQFGAGVKAWKGFGLQVIYNMGLSNIYLKHEGDPKLRLNTVQVNATFDVKPFGLRP